MQLPAAWSLPAAGVAHLPLASSPASTLPPEAPVSRFLRETCTCASGGMGKAISALRTGQTSQQARGGIGSEITPQAQPQETNGLGARMSCDLVGEGPA